VEPEEDSGASDSTEVEEEPEAAEEVEEPSEAEDE
jgi:hypothetical protein